MSTMLERKGTVAYNIGNSMEKLNACQTKKDVVDFVNSCIPEDKKSEKKIKELIYHVNAAKDLFKAEMVVTNFMLKSADLGVIR